MRLLGLIEQAFVVLLLCVIVAAISTQVVSRYAFNRPIVWVEEVAVYAFIWSVFIGAALALKYDRHLRIETFVSRLDRRAAAAARAFVALLILLLLVVLLPSLWTAVGIEMRRTTIALPVAIPSGWFFSVPLLAGVISMILTTAYRLWVELAQLAGAAPPAPIMPPLRSMDEEEEAAGERALLGDRP